MTKRTQKEWLELFQEIHKGKYDYSKMDINNKDANGKVCIICPIHGEFWQTLDNHKKGKGCPKCKGEKISKTKRSTVDDFIEKATKIHNKKYTYNKSNIDYKNVNTKVPIICPIHGEFWQTLANHLNGHGCPKCAHEKLWEERGKLTTDVFKERAKKVHKEKYDYSKSYVYSSNDKVCIICPIHGEFWQKAQSHLQGQGCPKCKHRSFKYTLDEVISLLKEKSNGDYDYSLIKSYSNNKEKLPIICKKHGIFMQTLQEHTHGCGCPKCAQSHLEKITETILNEFTIKNIHHCDKSYFDWLGLQHLDFYLPEYNVAIECQGIQHFKSIKYFGGDEKLKKIQKLDEEKRYKLKEHDIKLVYINYNFNEDKIKSIVENIYKK